MDRLDAAIEHFRETCHFRHIANRKPCLAQQSRRAAGGNQVHAQTRQSACEFNKPRFVSNAQQSACNLSHEKTIVAQEPEATIRS